VRDRYSERKETAAKSAAPLVAAATRHETATGQDSADELE
jgi:hypothetical protein